MPAPIYASSPVGTRPRLHCLGAIQAVSNYLARKSLTLGFVLIGLIFSRDFKGQAGTIVGPSTERLRVARSTLEKKIVKRYDLLLRVKHFLVVEGYDPRIHAVYFCPQLYKYDTDKKLVPLQGEEIGRT